MKTFPRKRFWDIYLLGAHRIPPQLKHLGDKSIAGIDSQTKACLLSPAGRTACVQIALRNLSNQRGENQSLGTQKIKPASVWDRARQIAGIDSQTKVCLLTPAGRTACVQIALRNLSNQGGENQSLGTQKIKPASVWDRARQIAEIDSQTKACLLTPAGRTACVQIALRNLSNQGGENQSLGTQKIKPAIRRVYFFGVPKGIRTPVAAVKGQCPRPLDDGDMLSNNSGLVLRARRLVDLHVLEPCRSALLPLNICL